VVATASRRLHQGETADITVAYAPGSIEERSGGTVHRRTYADLEVYGGNTPETYGGLDLIPYGTLEAYSDAVIVETINPDLYVRVRQQGPSRDAFHVHRVGLYDSPISWSFSNDGGATWWQAIDVRNDPHGVLIFPAATDASIPGVGRSLRWKANLFREDATINALHIRPWYGNRSRTAEPAHEMDALGPNKSVYDDFPATHRHPMWLPRFNPIEKPPVKEVIVEPFWRNLVPNPGAEGDFPDAWDATGGTITFGDWTGVVPAVPAGADLSAAFILPYPNSSSNPSAAYDAAQNRLRPLIGVSNDFSGAPIPGSPLWGYVLIPGLTNTVDADTEIKVSIVLDDIQQAGFAPYVNLYTGMPNWNPDDWWGDYLTETQAQTTIDGAWTATNGATATYANGVLTLRIGPSTNPNWANLLTTHGEYGVILEFGALQVTGIEFLNIPGGSA
jgi:hypothetical protein